MARRRQIVPEVSEHDLPAHLCTPDAWKQFFIPDEPLSDYWTEEKLHHGMGNYLRKSMARDRLEAARARYLSQLTVKPAGVGVMEFAFAHGLNMGQGGRPIGANADGTVITAPIEAWRADPPYYDQHMRPFQRKAHELCHRTTDFDRYGNRERDTK